MNIRTGMLLGATVAVACLLTAGAAVAKEPYEDYLDQVKIKRAIAEQLSPEQLEARRIRLAQQMAERAARPWPVTKVGADTCVAATNEIGTLPFGPLADTTVGRADDFDLPPDTTNPTCTAPTTCTGAGPAGSLPRGAIYTGTGTAPDFAYRIRTSANCTLNITMDPTGAQDLSLIVYESTCSSLLSDCVCADDTGVGGVAESVSLEAVAGTDYFVLVDGYSTGGTPPGPSGPFTVAITETTATGCALVGATPIADLSMAITDAPDPVNAGENITYTLTSANAGPAAADSVTLTTAVPAGTTFVSVTPLSSGSCTDPGLGGTGPVSCSFTASTAPAASQAVELVVAVDPSFAGPVDLNASTATTTMESNAANNSDNESTTVQSEADLAVSLSGSPDPVNAGALVTFQASVTNAGPSDGLGISVDIPVPADTTFSGFTADPAFSCTPPAGLPGSLACTAASIDAGTPPLLIDLVAAVDAGATAATIDGTATITTTSTDPDTVNNSAADSVVLAFESDLSISVDNGQDGAVDGQTVVYQVQVDNGGPSDALGSTVAVTLSSNLTAATWTCAASPTGTCANASGSGDINETVDLLSGDGLLFTVTATVAAQQGDVAVNAAGTVANGNSDPTPGDNADNDEDALLPLEIFTDGFEEP